VPGLLGDLDDSRALRDQEADEAVSEVILVPTSAQPRICRCRRYADVG